MRFDRFGILREYHRRRSMWEHSLTQDTYTVREAAELLNMSERRVRELIRSGELYAERLSERNTLIPKEAIIRYRVPPPFGSFAGLVE